MAFNRTLWQLTGRQVGKTALVPTITAPTEAHTLGKYFYFELFDMQIGHEARALMNAGVTY